MPAYWLPRPPLNLSQKAIERLETLYAQQIQSAKGGFIGGRLGVKKWELLCWLVEEKGHLLHGTGDAQIKLFEPRQSNDVATFGNRKAVYAASDGIWPMFFAVLDRSRYRMTINNAAIRLELPSGLTEPFYFFSASAPVLAQQPWREGVVYILPASGFEAESPYERHGFLVHTQQWASLKPVKPLAKLRVRPSDFPFLNQIRAHDDAVLGQRIAQNPQGFPWVEEAV